MERRILIVEDEEDILVEVSFILTKKGYNVIKCSDGEQALFLVKQEKPDMIILDLFLPKMSGIDVSRAIKMDDELKNIPILILTASVDNIAEKAVIAMADDYLIKPFEYLQLLDKITALIKE
ncbi:MAG: response regulator [Candidatus Omnitrophica bacterium]|nr:response regulator [Candidatus Omnitrophota bacterium]